MTDSSGAVSPARVGPLINTAVTHFVHRVLLILATERTIVTRGPSKYYSIGNGEQPVSCTKESLQPPNPFHDRVVAEGVAEAQEAARSEGFTGNRGDLGLIEN